MADYKKNRYQQWGVSGNHYIVTGVSEPTQNGHVKHSVGSITDNGRDGDEKKRKYFQFWSYASSEREAKIYEIGTVLEINESDRTSFTSTTNPDNEYVTLEMPFVHVIFPAGMLRKILTEGEQPQYYNAQGKDKPDATPEAVTADDDDEF